MLALVMVDHMGLCMFSVCHWVPGMQQHQVGHKGCVQSVSLGEPIVVGSVQGYAACTVVGNWLAPAYVRCTLF